MTDRRAELIARMRIDLTNVIGFYGLLYEREHDLPPYRHMTYEAHFATSARSLAVALLEWIDTLPDDDTDGT